LQGLLRPGLEQVVGHGDRQADVRVEIADGRADRRIRDLAVADGHRADHGLVQLVVERVDLAVELLVRVVGTGRRHVAGRQEGDDEDA